MTAGPSGRALIAALASVVLVATFTATACHRGGSSQFFMDTAVVSRQSIVITVSATGTVEPAEVVSVKSKASGQIVKMPVQMGTLVKPGDLIAQIDPRDPQSRYNQAVAALNAAKANVDVTKTALARAEQLYNERALTAPDHEQAVVGYANAQSSLATARTNLEVAQIQLADVTIRAPEAGTIIDKEVSEGQVIASATSSVSGGTTLVTLANLQNIVDSALVTESDVAKVHVGETVTVTADAYPNRTFHGMVSNVSPQAVTIQSVTMFPVIIRLDNSSGLLKPGMNSDVSILVEQRTNALTIPNDAVGTQQDIAQAIVAFGGDQSALTQVTGQTRGSGAGKAGRGGRRGGADSAGGTVTRADSGVVADSASRSAAHSGLVLVLQNGKWVPRRVMLGIGNYDATEVLSGLQEGDRVALVAEIRVQASRDSSLSRLQSRAAFPASVAVARAAEVEAAPGAVVAAEAVAVDESRGGPTMLIRETLSVALNALRVNKLRSLLTMLGIVIGVGAVIAMVALGRGAQNSVNDRIAALGTTLLTVSPGQVSSRGIASATDRARLTSDDADALERDGKYIAAVEPEMSRSLQVQLGAANANTTVLGTSPNYLDVRKYTLAAGSMFTAADDDARARFAVVGQTVLSSLGVGNDIVGQEIRINSIPFKVIGTLATKGSGGGFGDPDDQILIPLGTARFRVFTTKDLRAIGVLAPSESLLTRAMVDIDRVLRRSHHIAPGGAADFQIRNQADVLNTFAATTQAFTLLLAGIAAVSLIVGGIGIMNIMLVSVTERTREIGVRKALGATRRNILLQFLIESVVLSLLGGFIGVCLGAGSAVMFRYLLSWNTAVAPSSIVLAFGFSALVGVAFGVWPARRAAALDPIVSLRYE